MNLFDEPPATAAPTPTAPDPRVHPDPIALSPLSSTSVEDIFQLDPSGLPDSDFTALVSEVRRRRSVFHAEEAAKAAKGKSVRAKTTTQAAPKAAALDKPNAELSLTDLI